MNLLTRRPTGAVFHARKPIINNLEQIGKHIIYIMTLLILKGLFELDQRPLSRIWWYFS